ncbi:MAG: diguanylate cyclase [Pseudomonadota bacterium]
MKLPTGRLTFPGNTFTSVALLLSIPFIVLSLLLTRAVIEHERTFSEAGQVLAIYRAGLSALAPLEEMRSLSRPANMLQPQPEIARLYRKAHEQVRSGMTNLFALLQERTGDVPGLGEPLHRLRENLSSLDETGAGIENSAMGPFRIVSLYIDQVNAVLATTLYTATLPGGESARAAELLLPIPDTLRRAQQELGIMHTLSIPSALNESTVSSTDIFLVDEALSDLSDLIDTLDSQLRGMEAGGSRMPADAGAARLQDVRDYLDHIEESFIFTNARQDWQSAHARGNRAQGAIHAVAEDLVNTTETGLGNAKLRQRIIDSATAAGLLLLYAALIHFSRRFYLARDAALRERELAREVAERKARENELRLLNQLSELLMACHTSAQAYEVFGRSAAALFAGSQGALAVTMPDTDKMRTVSEWGGTTRLMPSFPADHCAAIHSGQPLTASGESTTCRHFLSPPGHQHACLPLLMQNQTLGMLWLESENGQAIDSQLQLATSAGEALKLALSNIQLREALHEQAIRDSLTDLYNRRYLHEVFNRELAQACRSGQPLAIALLDIDHFKQVNDRYGHDAGDQALIALAQHLRSGLRVSDLCFRLGGEEFVLLLHADEAGALKCVDTLRARFQERSFRFREHPPCQLTFSAGVVEAPRHGDSLDQLLQLADAALYQAKSQGRNRVLTSRPAA